MPVTLVAETHVATSHRSDTVTQPIRHARPRRRWRPPQGVEVWMFLVSATCALLVATVIGWAVPSLQYFAWGVAALLCTAEFFS